MKWFEFNPDIRASIWMVAKLLGLQPVHAYTAACFVAAMSEIRGIAARVALRRIAQGEVEDTASYAEKVLSV